MDVLDRGFSFRTFHQPDGNVAHVRAAYRRFQTQAPIGRTHKFEMDFFGRGAGMELGVMALPQRAPPQAMTAVRRERASALRTMTIATASATRGTTAGVATRADRLGPVVPAVPTTPATPPEPNAPTTLARSSVQPEFNSPFDRDWIDWDLEPRIPPDPTVPPGGGGGSSFFHGAVLLQLFIFGDSGPVQTWLLDEGVGPRIRKVKFEIQGFPTPDSPMLRKGWWRLVAIPFGGDPVEIEITADVSLGDVPIRTTPLSTRLADHIFRVGLEALVPDAEVAGNTARVTIGSEIAELLETETLLLSENISPVSSRAKLRSLNITTISGAELHALARQRYKERAKRHLLAQSFNDAQLEQFAATLFKPHFLRLGLVQPDYVCIRIEAAFSDAEVSVSGFEVASLRGDLGEFVLAFDRTLTRVLPFSFLDVKFSTLASIAIEIVNLFTEVPSNVNALIEQLMSAQEQHVLKFLRLFLSRAVGLNSFVHDFKLQNSAWQIRHSDDPVIPRPSDPVLPPVGGPLDGSVIAMMARGGVFGEMPSVPLVAVPSAPIPPPVTTAALPAGFLPPPAKLAVLDRHQSVVVVMMENRSYDHLLGDLMNARPRTTDPYDGAPEGIQNAGVAGFLSGVPTVRTRDLRLGTAIPVSPAHNFDAVQFQIGDGTEEGRGTGDMQGFARDLYRRTDSPQLALTVYGESDLPTYYKLATEFCVCDRWFAAHPGPTWPNRIATIAGQIPDRDNFDIDDPRIGYLKLRTVFDALTNASIDWRVFESDLSLVRMFDRFRLDDRHVLPIDDEDVGLEATLRNRSRPLPRVMFVEPNFTDIPPLKTANDDLAPTDLKQGQAFIARVCDLIWDSGRFQDVLLVITYDEHGGFYDHVAPPGSPKGEPATFAPLIEGGPTYPGVRVPAFVISPFVSSGKVEKTVFDHTSILKTILLHNRDRLGATTLTSFGPRVNAANDLSAVLDLTAPRQNPVPFVRRGPDRPSSRFGELVDFASVLELTSLSSPAGLTSITPPLSTPLTATSDVSSGRTPRVITVTERIPKTPEAADPGDFHLALARMLRPRIPR